MDIKVGEYVRTRDGKIDKVINPEFYIETYIECQKGLVTKDAIKKHSFDIIYLIEAGDYVNGKEVHQVGYNFQDIVVCKISINKYEDYFIYPKDIKTIVTNEQFESVSYEV